MTLCYTGIPNFLSQGSNKGLFTPIGDTVCKDLLDSPLRVGIRVLFIHELVIFTQSFFYDIKKADVQIIFCDQYSDYY